MLYQQGCQCYTHTNSPTHIHLCPLFRVVLIYLATVYLTEMEGHDYEMAHLEAETHDSDAQTDTNIQLPANSAYELDNRRRAALAEVDNARISYVDRFRA